MLEVRLCRIQVELETVLGKDLEGLFGVFLRPSSARFADRVLSSETVPGSCSWSVILEIQFND